MIFMIRLILILLLTTLLTTILYSSEEVVLTESFNFNRLCHQLEKHPFKKRIKKRLNQDFNAFLQAKKQHVRKQIQQKILAKTYLAKLSSNQFFLENYNFRDGYFLINSFTIKNALFIPNHPIKINVSRREAIELALLKELGELELYLQFKLSAPFPQATQFCAHYHNSALFFPKIKNILVTTQRGDQELLSKKHRRKKHLFLKSPMVEGLTPEKAKKLKYKLIHLNRRIGRCVSHKKPGIRLYQLKIDKKGEIRTVGSTYSTLSKESEGCIDNLLKTQHYPLGDHLDYHVYFSIVVSNLKK